MNAAIYARKSTDDKDTVDESRAIPQQVAAARSFIESKGWAVEHVYEDWKTSGALFASRVEFQRLMRDARAGVAPVDGSVERAMRLDERRRHCQWVVKVRQRRVRVASVDVHGPLDAG